jgi:hypothetical protein
LPGRFFLNGFSGDYRGYILSGRFFYNPKLFPGDCVTNHGYAENVQEIICDNLQLYTDLRGKSGGSFRIAALAGKGLRGRGRPAGRRAFRNQIGNACLNSIRRLRGGIARHMIRKGRF